MCCRPNRGECSQHKHHKCQVDGTQPHGVVVLHRSVVSPVPGILNLSDYVDPPSVPPTTGQRSTPPAPAWSAEQLQGAGHQQAHSVSDDVKRNMNVMILDIFVNLSIFISFTVFVCIFLKVFVCMFLKVFVWTMDEVIELWWTFYYCILWTMNFMNYELWTAMNSNCDMVNCCEGSKVLCLYKCVLGI